MIDAEDTVLVGIEGHRATLLLEVAIEGFQVGLGGLGGGEAQGQQLTGGIVDEDDERTAWAPVLEPVVGGAVDLDQLAPAGTALMDARLLACLGCPEAFCDHPLAQGLDRHLVAMTISQLLACQGGAEIGIAGANQVEDLPPHPLGDPVVGMRAPAAGNQPRRPLGPVSLNQTLDLPHTKTQLPGRLLLPKPSLHHLTDHPRSIQFLSTHRNVLLCHRPS